jgi:hypothetical protein
MFFPCMLKVTFDHGKFNYTTFRFEWWYDGVDWIIHISIWGILLMKKNSYV